MQHKREKSQNPEEVEHVGNGMTHKEKKAFRKQRKAEKRAARSPVVNGIFIGLKAMFITMAVLFAGALIVFYFTYGRQILRLRQEAIDLVEQSDADTFRCSETSLVYDTDGKLLSEIKGEKDSYYIEYDEIPQQAVDAMVAIEDKSFYKHKGVDPKAVLRAGWSFLKNRGKITEGGSTITQQLARNIFLSHEVSWERKIKEMFIAWELEKKYSKEQIMEFYLNNIYFANGYYGIEAASQGYFSQTVKELSLAQITFLCAIPNNPTMYDPTEHKKDTIDRRNRILEQMKIDGFITNAQCEKAQDKKTKLELKTVKRRNYIETYVYDCATIALMERQGFEIRHEFDSDKERKRYDREYEEVYNECHQMLYSSGLRIYTSIDTLKQRKLQESVNAVLAGFTGKNEEGIYELQGAAACIENATGRVVAIVGGRSQHSDYYTLNRAFQSFRQPGSTIKPVVVYTPAFELGYSPDSVFKDEPIEDGPKNADLTYAGNMTLRRAVELSRNTIPWKLYEEISPEEGLSRLTSMGFSKIKDGDDTLAVCLGGMTVGVSTVEMASAYSAIENDGNYRNPSCIVKIEDAHGEVIVGEDIKEKNIYRKNAARMMTSCLEGVMTNGTGRGLGITGMPCAGKTGTTNDLKDGWFVGYTPYYTTSVWVGYDIPRELDSLSGNTYPGKIWQGYMQWLHEGLPARDFPNYKDVSQIKNEEGISLRMPAPVAVPERSEEPEEEVPKKNEDEILPSPGEEEDGGEEDDAFYDELEEPEGVVPEEGEGNPVNPEGEDVEPEGTLPEINIPVEGASEAPAPAESPEGEVPVVDNEIPQE